MACLITINQWGDRSMKLPIITPISHYELATVRGVVVEQVFCVFGGGFPHVHQVKFFYTGQ